MHFLTQLANGVIAVANRVFVVNSRQYLGERRIRFDMLFELGQHRHQSRQFFRAFRRRQQEQNRVEIALLRHDAVFAQVVRQDGRRDAKLGIVAAIGIDARRGQQQLTRIDKVLIVSITAKAVPARARLEAKEATFAGDSRRRMLLPRFPADQRRHKWPQ